MKKYILILIIAGIVLGAAIFVTAITPDELEEIENPPDITQDALDTIKQEHKISDVIIAYEAAKYFENGTANCDGTHCHYIACTNFRGCFNIMRDMEGETNQSILEGLDKRIIHKEVQRINRIYSSMAGSNEQVITPT